MKRKHKRAAIIFCVLAILAGVLYLTRDPVIRWLYLNEYFDTAFSDTRMTNGSLPKVINFDFSLQDREYFNSFSEKAGEVSNSQKVGLIIDNRNHTVDLTPFKNYFKELSLNRRKTAFSIEFSPVGLPDHRIPRWDLFQVNRVDFYRQELVYRLGRRLGLYIPRTEFLNVYINYADYGDYAFKQAFDGIFLEQNRMPGSIVFMLESERNGGDDETLRIRYLYNPSGSRRIRKHIEQFLVLLEQQDPNLLVKYFDLDYIARFETLRQLLGARPGFVMAANLRYIYNRISGKFYPVLDESNIYNHKEGIEDKYVALLRKQIDNHPLVKQRVKTYMAQLAGNYQAVKRAHKTVWKKYRNAGSGLLYFIRFNVVSDYFASNVYGQLRTLAKKQADGETPTVPGDGEPEKMAGLASAGAYMDRMILSPRVFIEENKHLHLHLDENKIRLQAGEYTIEKTLVVPVGVVFEIEAGATIIMAPDISLVSYSPVRILGTAEKPVTIKAQDPGDPFDVFAVMGCHRQVEAVCLIRHLDFSGGSRAFINGVRHSGAMNIYDMETDIRDSRFHHNRNNGLTIKNSVILLENNDLYQNRSDQLTLDYCRGFVTNNRFRDSGSDVDSDGAGVEGSRVYFESNRFENLADKGASIGKHAAAIFYGNRFFKCGAGVAARDMGRLLLLNNLFKDNTVAVTAYQKKAFIGGGNIYLFSNAFVSNRQFRQIDKFSRIYDLRSREKQQQELERLLIHKDLEKLFASFTRLQELFPFLENRIETFYVGDTAARVDNVNNVIFVDLPPGSEKKQPIRFTGSLENSRLSVIPTSRGIRYLPPGSAKEQEIENNRQYDFKEFIFRGQLSLKHQFQVDVYELFVSTGALPIVEIDSRSPSGTPQKIMNEPKIPCQIRFVGDPHPMAQPYINRFYDSRIEGRGTKWPKWKYGFTLSKGVAPGGMPRSRRWVLESSYVERSLIRAKISFDLMDRFRDPKRKRITPRSMLVEVYLDGSYQGVYLLMQHVDKDFLGLADFDKYEPNNALLYRARNRNANFSRLNNYMSLYKDQYEDFPGGTQPLAKDSDQIMGWSSGFEQRHPGIDRYGEYWQPLKEFAMFTAQATDAQFEQEIADKLDIDRFINLWLLIQLADDSDGLFQNRYLAREKGSTQWYFVPWDKDGVFGRDYRMNKRPHTLWLSSNLFNRCMKMDWFRESFKTAWQTLRVKGVINAEAILIEFDRLAGQLVEARKRNFKKWPATSPPYPDNYEFYRERGYFKYWISFRIQWLDERINNIHKYFHETLEQENDR